MVRPALSSTLRAVALAAVLAAAATALAAPATSARAQRIRAFANGWLGTPYLWGGETKGGVDCSAFVRQMFRDLFNVELPRTTKDQINLGIDLPVNPANLEAGLLPGDLFFFIDRVGVPNHVVAYAGSGQLTHSVSGRGVVFDPMKYLWGRRIVIRRVLVPSSRDGSDNSFAAIPAAGPIIPKEIPCPPSVTARASEVRAYATKAVDLKALGERGICDFRALAQAIRAKSSDAIAQRNAATLEQHAIWLESIEALQEDLMPRRE